MSISPITTSLALALRLNVKHDKILASIEKVRASCSPELARHFMPRTFTDAAGRQCQHWHVTVEGLFLLGADLPRTSKRLRFRLQREVVAALSRKIDALGDAVGSRRAVDERLLRVALEEDAEP